MMATLRKPSLRDMRTLLGLRRREGNGEAVG
jgi:hypothetical protein